MKISFRFRLCKVFISRIQIKKVSYKSFNISYCEVHHLCNHSCMSISSRRNMQSNWFKCTSLYKHERTIGCFYFILQYSKTHSVFTPLFICLRFLSIDINTMKNFYDMHYFHQFQTILPLSRLPPLSNRHYVLLTTSSYKQPSKCLEYCNV